MITRLVEFQNSRHITLRGILVESNTTRSNIALVCVAGFEGLSSTAPKFVNLTTKLLLSSKNPIDCVLRYDPTGIGLSDGIYDTTTISTLMDDLSHVINYLLQYYTKFIFIGHSLGSCIITKFVNSNSGLFQVEKIILLAPALNQYDLHRYWFMQQTHGALTWRDFRERFRESEFQEYLDTKPAGACKSFRAHRILYEFIRLCSQEDFSCQLNEYQNQLFVILGDQDPVVPIESIKDRFRNTLILHSDDHDLEEPDILQEWTTAMINFICNEQ